MYFADPDGNPYEITCYDYAALAPALHGVPGAVIARSIPHHP